MNKLYAIAAATAVSIAAWVICNVIAYGAQANYAGVITVGAVSGLLVGLACLVFKSVNPIVSGIVTMLGAYIGVAALFIWIGIAHLPEINLELAWTVCVMALVGAVSGYGYKLVAR